MPLDAVALGAIAHELECQLVGAKIEKIHQPERDELLLVVKGNSGTKKLVISASSANARIHLIDESKENPATPPMFCMLLRKHLTGGRIQSIQRLDFERVVDIEILCRNELGDLITRHLLCEIMGRNSNIIFVDENKRIIDSIKHIDLTVSSLRNILPGLIYMMPPDNNRLNPLNSKEEDYYNLLKNAPEGREISRAITDGVMGISPLLAAECVYRVCKAGKLVIGETDDCQKMKIAQELFQMFKRTFENVYEPCIIYSADKNKVIDFAPFIISQYENGAEIKCAESVNEAACEFYFKRDLNARMNDRSAAITRVITNNLKRAEKKLNILQCELKESENREHFRVCGDLITANIHCIKKGDVEFVAINFYSEKGEEIVIMLDKKLTPSQNASRYYTKYKKAKNTQIYAAEQIENTLQEIAYLESVLYSVSNARTPSHLAEIRSELISSGYIRPESNKKKKTSPQALEKPLEFVYNGYTIWVGRNNIQNDLITLKMSRSNDLWLHTKNIPGSHTLIKYKGEDFPPDVIETAASLAAFYSKGKNSPYVEVDYCPVSHVKKPSGAKAGMVIYEGYNTAFVKPREDLAENLRK